MSCERIRDKMEEKNKTIIELKAILFTESSRRKELLTLPPELWMRKIKQNKKIKNSFKMT